MSTTPRTDAAEINAYTAEIPPRGFYVPADLARQLERELANALKERDQAQVEFFYLQNRCLTATSADEIKSAAHQQAQNHWHAQNSEWIDQLCARVDKLAAANALLREAKQRIKSWGDRADARDLRVCKRIDAHLEANK